jgi:hypothetical protein
MLSRAHAEAPLRATEDPSLAGPHGFEERDQEAALRCRSGSLKANTLPGALPSQPNGSSHLYATATQELYLRT